jgi:hypothetical protein
MSQPLPPVSANERSLRLWRAAALVLAGIVAALIFLAYSRPDLLIEFANLRYCG